MWQRFLRQIHEMIRPAPPELDGAHVAQGRVDPEVVLPVDPIEQGGAQPLLGAEPPARDEPLFRIWFVDSTTALSCGLPGLETDLAIPKSAGIASISALQNSGPRSEWDASIPSRGNSMFESAALTSAASLRRPHEHPIISLSCRSTSRHAQRQRDPART